jgi:hypothetical protein
MDNNIETRLQTQPPYMIPRAMPGRPPKPVRSRMREEAKNNPRRRELGYKFP